MKKIDAKVLIDRNCLRSAKYDSTYLLANHPLFPDDMIHSTEYTIPSKGQ